MTELEQHILELTRPLNGQYPRPWMTSMRDPQHARVFVVGRNQATGFPTDRIGSQDAYLDALFNRDGRSMRALYDELRSADGKGPSPTRQNQDRLTESLRRAGVTEVLETNVICYSTPMSSDLARREHTGGRKRGSEIFTTLLDLIRPPVLIAHGAGTHKELAGMLDVTLPDAPESLTDGVRSTRVESRLAGERYTTTVFVLPSLAPPAFNRWSGWAREHLDAVALAVATELGR